MSRITIPRRRGLGRRLNIPKLSEDFREEEKRLRLTMPLEAASSGMLRTAMKYNSTLKAIEAAGWLGHPDRETSLQKERRSAFPAVTETMFQFIAAVADWQKQDEVERDAAAAREPA